MDVLAGRWSHLLASVSFALLILRASLLGRFDNDAQTRSCCSIASARCSHSCVSLTRAMASTMTPTIVYFYDNACSCCVLFHWNVAFNLYKLASHKSAIYVSHSGDVPT